MPNRAKIFWTSYADLMTSLFFIMLVMFVLAVAMMKKQQRATELQIERIKQIEESVSNIDTTYFEYQKRYKRHKLKIDVNFLSNSFSINDIPENQRLELIKAGKKLFKKMEDLSNGEEKKINYLLIIEGNAQKYNNNHITAANNGYILSYNRSLALVNFWKQNNIRFSQLDNCEMLIVGSGYFGKNRELKESENRKFTIQITPKISLEDLENKKKQNE